MCPACFSVVAAYVVGASSIGGVATLLLKRFGRRDNAARSEHAFVADLGKKRSNLTALSPPSAIE
jgi:hypothetical protein